MITYGGLFDIEVRDTERGGGEKEREEEEANMINYLVGDARQFCSMNQCVCVCVSSSD